MDWAKYRWPVEAVAKFALLGGPALVILWRWKKSGSHGKLLYRASWINWCAYLLWLLAMCFLSIVSGAQSFQWLTSRDLLASFAVFVPLLCSLGSALLFFLSFRAIRDERRYSILYSVLMLILWIVSVVAPN